MPANESYAVLHTASMVGLFSCIFVKTSSRPRISSVHSVEIKRGMGGLHGNKVRDSPLLPIVVSLICRRAR